MNNDSDGVVVMYGGTGFILGMISAYIFEWPVWAVLITSSVGPIVLGMLLLVSFFIWWGIVGD